MDTTLRFAYKKSPFLSCIGVLLGFCGAAYFYQFAASNTTPYTTKYGFEMSPEQTTMALYAIALGCVFISINSFLMLLRAVTTKQEVVLSETDISAPKSALSKTPTVVAYARINSVKIKSSQGQKMLEIHHSDGKLTIIRQMCRNGREFKKIHEALTARLA